MEQNDQNEDDVDVQHHHLGIFGIYKHSFSIISKHPRTFLSITTLLTTQQAYYALTPLFKPTLYLLCKIIKLNLDNTITTISDYDDLPKAAINWINKEHPSFWFTLCYFAICVCSVSAITYATALVHYGIVAAPNKKIPFKTAAKFVRRFWKSVVTAYLWIFAAAVVWTGIIFGLLFATTRVVFFFDGDATSGRTKVWFLVLYVVILIHIRLIASMALVISVLEEKGIGGWGYEPLVKSMALLKGRLLTAYAIFVTYYLCLGFVQTMVEMMIVRFNDNSSTTTVVELMGLAGLIILGFIAMVFLYLYWYVLQTVLYAACKSYHGESIDKDVMFCDYLLLCSNEDDGYTPIGGQV